MNSNQYLLYFVLFSITISILSLINNIDNVKAEDQNDPLPSWNEGIVKQKIIAFVQNVTNPENTDYFIPIEDRIAVIDNDGTLWSEKPFYFQGFFSFDRLEELIKDKPQLKQQSPFKEYVGQNYTVLEQLNEKDIMELILITHSNITQIEFNNFVKEWAEYAKHPGTKILFVDMVYQPMLELIDFLKTNQFKTYIVSGGGVDFMRESLSNVYGIPPEQVIGSSIKYQFIDKFNAKESEIKYNNTSFILRKAQLDSLNNDYVKPENIQLHIGKVPIIAIGNSDGDLQMLEYSDDNNDQGKSLQLLIHHDDPIREFSYDKGAENVLKEAQVHDWTVVSMKDDFLNIFKINK